MSTQPVFYPGILIPVVSPIDQGINRVNVSALSVWNTRSEVTIQSAYQWAITGYQITVDITSQFNVRYRVRDLGQFYFSSLPNQVVSAIDYRSFIPQLAFNVEVRKSAFKKITWDAAQRRARIKAIAWDILVTEYTNTTTRFNVLAKVHKPGVTAGKWINQVLDQVVKPISTPNFTPSPSVQWNLARRLSGTETIRFNTLLHTKVFKASAFNTNDIAVTATVPSSWNLKKKLSPQISSSWKLVQRTDSLVHSTWNVRNPVVKQESSHWKVFNKVTASKAVAWAMELRIHRDSESRFNTLSRYKKTSAASWNALFRIIDRNWQLVFNSPGNITSGIVHPIDVPNPAGQPLTLKGLLAPVTSPVDGAYFSSYGQSPNPGIAWRVGINPNGRVTTQVQSLFNDLLHVKTSEAVSWKSIQRTGFACQSKFNVRVSASATASSSWIIGPATGTHIRQLAQERIDFAY